MSKLHVIVKQLTEAAIISLHADIKLPPHPAQTPGIFLTDALPLDKLEEAARKTTTEVNPNLPFAYILLDTIKVIYPPLKENEYLTEHKKIEIHRHLITLITGVNKLLKTAQTETIIIRDNIQIHGFLGEIGYSKLGDFMSDTFSSLLNITEDAQVSLSEEIDSIIEAYQQEVGLPYFQARCAQLERENRWLRAMLPKDTQPLPYPVTTQSNSTTQLGQFAHLGLFNPYRVRGAAAPPPQSSPLPTTPRPDSMKKEEEEENCSIM